jgi:uncharacterized protein YdeI (YjbR/CyaY-like superfamily)
VCRTCRVCKTDRSIYPPVSLFIPQRSRALGLPVDTCSRIRYDPGTKITLTFHAPGRAVRRAWLAANGTAEREIWLICYKKHTGTPCVSYEAAVEEALCFGWIDGLMKRMDEDRYAQRFSPRKLGRQPSASRSTPLRMRPRREPSQLCPTDLLARLQADEAAWVSFNRLLPSHRRQYIGWIMDAARPETRRRLEEAIAKLMAGRPLGMR